MDLLFTNISELDLFSNVLDTFKKHPKVWHDNNNREIVGSTVQGIARLQIGRSTIKGL